MRKAQLIFGMLLIASCTPKQRETDYARIFREGKKLAELKAKKLAEVSGLAASVRNPGLLWAHSDSGNPGEIYLIDLEIEIQQTYVLHGIENRDWEDIAVGPGPDSTKQYVYIAEIGDNEAMYQRKYIYRFEEPAWTSKEGAITITDFDTITFQLPDRIKDAEALLIDPTTKDLYIISKREEPVYLYQIKYPYSTKDTITALQVGPLQLTQIVAGDVSPDGREVLLKNYNHVYYWRNSSNKPITELLQDVPQEVPYKQESQGESIAWARDNSGFYTMSEKNMGAKSFLYFYSRK